jgi:hypothetical protein
VNIENSIFFLKIHEAAWKRLESYIWIEKRMNFESSIFFHENLWKLIKNTWISHLNWDSSEFEISTFFHENSWKRMKILESHIWIEKRLNFESSKFFHENLWKRMKNTWISNLNWEKNELWKFDIFSWKFMKAHEKYLNLTFELDFERSLKYRHFVTKNHERAWKILESHIWIEKRMNFES